MNLTYSNKSLAIKSLLGRYPLGTKVTMRCNNSTYQLMGPTEVICTDEGTWDGYKDDISCSNLLLLLLLLPILVQTYRWT